MAVNAVVASTVLPGLAQPTLAPTGAAPSHTRKPSLRRTQDSRENLHRRKNSKASKTIAHARQESSASRGRDFRVGNIGNNGLIYLRSASCSMKTRHTATSEANSGRPVKRTSQLPAHSSVSTSVSTVPTIPESADLHRRSSAASGTLTRHSILSTSSPRVPQPLFSPRGGHKHSKSVSKSEFRSSDRSSPNPRALKVVIDRASRSQAPSTAKTLESLPIPHYRLGTPHFTEKGSAVLHSSVNTASSRENNVSPDAIQQPVNLAPKNYLSDHFVSRSDFPTFGGPKLSPTTLKRTLHKAQSREQQSAQRVITPTQQTQIVKLSGTPTSTDLDPEIRISRATGQVLAATIPQLITQITSPRVLDYDLLSDFFLTYRQFMSSSDLAGRLIKRLQHAIQATDEFSRIVRVRTFVALRHWILNYFVDDFVSNHDLRTRFCLLVNELCHGLERDAPQHAGDLRIVEELKKCWRHTCALFWEVTLTPNPDTPHEDITPGGGSGSENAPLDWSDERLRNIGSQQDHPSEDIPCESSPDDYSSEPEFAFNRTHKLGSSIISSSTSLSGISETERQSIQVLSCSIPASIFTSGKHRPALSIGPRPVPSATRVEKQRTQPPSTAENSKTNHTRSGSFSDALRDDRAPLPAPKVEAEESSLTPIVIPGSLIRGATMSPAMPYVENNVQASLIAESEYSETISPLSVHPADQRGRQFYQTNPGVRRFIGSVRRALSAKNAVESLSTRSPNRGREEMQTALHLRNTQKSEPSAQKRTLIDGRSVLRIDLLAAEVHEAFREAMVQVQNAQRAFEHGEPQLQATTRDSVANSYPQTTMLQIPHSSAKSVSMSTGSRSIVILDDTEGQVTPRSNLDQHGGHLRPLQGQADSMLPHGEGVQSVPIFLDQGIFGPTELQFDERKLCPESVTVHQEPSEDDNLRTPRAEVPHPTSTYPEQASSSRHPSTEAATTMTDDTQTSTNDPFHLERAPPLRQIRRLPAGNLRAANHVHSLDEHSHSSFDQSIGSMLHAHPRIPARTSSSHAKELHATASAASANVRQREVVSHNSQPIMRASFEREVAKLAQIPDFSESENGIASALAKLEGRGEVPSKEPPDTFLVEMGEQSTDAFDIVMDVGNTPIDHRETRRLHRKGETVELSETPPRIDTRDAAYPYVTVQHKAVSMTDSSLSHSSIPLLERGISHPPKPRTDTRSRADQPLITDPKEIHGIPNGPGAPNQAVRGSEDSYDLVERDDGLEQARIGKRPAVNLHAHQSFLLNENESLSELSSPNTGDVSEAHSRASPGMNSLFEEEDERPANISQHTPSKILHRQSSSTQFVTRSTDSEPGSPEDQYQVDPAYVPGNRAAAQEKVHAGERGHPRSAEDLFSKHGRHYSSLTHAPSAAHLPFILSYDSLQLAQQFTVIERDALCEIDWRDLIDLRWNQRAVAYYNWVDFLRSNGATDAYGQQVMRPGVDMCIARFNMVVRWVKSEIVLAQDLADRVATIVKLVHIAVHARRLRNWATMYQIAMSLVSADVSRLKQTWAAVPKEEKESLAQLEELIMPKRNFYNLRQEVQGATSTWAEESDGGCIPFIGIYTHDLIYNAQKPARVRISARGALVDAASYEADVVDERAVLINFDRHHTAATIVKNLLRLIEASSKYSFQPDAEIASRCLWIGALHDAEVTRRSKELESFERVSA